MIPTTLRDLPLARATAGGTTATIRQVGDRRFRLHLSYDDAPSFVRVFQAFSLRHLAELLRIHVPDQGVRAITDALARAEVLEQP